MDCGMLRMAAILKLMPAIMNLKDRFMSSDKQGINPFVEYQMDCGMLRMAAILKLMPAIMNLKYRFMIPYSTIVPIMQPAQ